MENRYFTLEIISPTDLKELTIEWVEIESPTGSFVVGPSHSPIISTLKKRGFLTYKPKDQEPIKIEVMSGGLFKAAGNKAILLLDSF
jgi:F0F1-type ATP synthase epsilon subunit